jgi:U3 small nucleolar RNA-associated protein 14
MNLWCGIDAVSRKHNLEEIIFNNQVTKKEKKYEIQVPFKSKK